MCTINDKKRLIGVCFQITSKCNLRCPICYVELNKYENLDLNKIKIIINNISKLGVNKINFTGGEPLTYENITEIAAFTQSKGIKTALSTNGTLITPEFLHELEKCFDEISVSLDGHNFEINSLHRTRLCNFKRIISILEQSKNLKTKIDVATVVSNVNKSYMINILCLLRKYKIYKWKVFQYSRLIQTNRNYETYQIHDEDFLNIVENILCHIKNQNINIELDYRFDNKDYMKSYVNILPNGDIALADIKQYKIIGNILHCKKVESIFDLLSNNDFNFQIHEKRHFRDF